MKRAACLRTNRKENTGANLFPEFTLNQPFPQTQTIVPGSPTLSHNPKRVLSRKIVYKRDKTKRYVSNDMPRNLMSIRILYG